MGSIIDYLSSRTGIWISGSGSMIVCTCFNMFPNWKKMPPTTPNKPSSMSPHVSTYQSHYWAWLNRIPLLLLPETNPVQALLTRNAHSRSHCPERGSFSWWKRSPYRHTQLRRALPWTSQSTSILGWNDWTSSTPLVLILREGPGAEGRLFDRVVPLPCSQSS